jgi:hypothetical protein
MEESIEKLFPCVQCYLEETCSGHKGGLIGCVHGKKTKPTEPLKCPDCGKEITEVMVEAFSNKNFIVDYVNKRLVAVNDEPWDENDRAIHCPYCDSLNVDELFTEWDIEWDIIPAEPNFMAAYYESDGENEYISYVFIKAADMAEADKKLHDYLEAAWPDGKWERDRYFYEDYSLNLRVGFIEEIDGSAREAIYQKITKI